jgi:hypothetical protein
MASIIGLMDASGLGREEVINLDLTNHVPGHKNYIKKYGQDMPEIRTLQRTLTKASVPARSWLAVGG